MCYYFTQTPFDLIAYSTLLNLLITKWQRPQFLIHTYINFTNTLFCLNRSTYLNCTDLLRSITFSVLAFKLDKYLLKYYVHFTLLENSHTLK